jgi:hypothetical protein
VCTIGGGAGIVKPPRAARRLARPAGQLIFMVIVMGAEAAGSPARGR